MHKQEAQAYIDKLLDRSFYESSCSSNAGTIDIDEIFQRVTSSKFRKTSMDEDTIIDVRKKIEDCVTRHEPIQFSVPFGAYKAWRLQLGFRPDWSEVFNISFLLKYASAIAAVYSPGVDIAYTYSDDLMYFVSDFPRDCARQYTQDFCKLLELFNTVNPKIHFSLKKINDLYESAETYYIDFLKQFLDNLVFWNEKYDENTKKRHLNSARRNVNLFGARKIGEQSDEVKEKYYYYSALMTDAVDCLKERRKFNKEQDRIQLVGVRGPSKCLNLGACETSTVHFWTGRGCLKINKGRIKSYIYTFSNIEKIYEDANFSEYDMVSVFSTISDNYNKILFIKEDK